MAIYTRKGDTGTTSFFGGRRVVKSHIRVNAYGTVDELNSVIGIAAAHCTKKERIIQSQLTAIQSDLLTIGAALAKPSLTQLPELADRVVAFEKTIDAMTNQMPALKQFILPGGTLLSAHLHHARTVSRRAERRVVRLLQREEVDVHIVQYLNRLSDLFFTLARYANFLSGTKDSIWKTAPLSSK